MAKIAGIPIAGVTKESRAAFVRAQKDVTSGLGRNVEKGAIVFDMGSSTLDFTYMNKNLTMLIDHGYDCGASFIEKAIFASKESDDDAIKLFEEKYPDLVDYLVFEVRKVKEQVYFDPELRVKKTINFDDIIEDEDLEDERIKLQFKPGELNEMLRADGYIKQIEDAMVDYRKNYINDQKIYGVFMTGGASRMDFLKELICKSWEIDETQIYRDQDPSLTISQGVAEVARQDLRTEGMDKDIEGDIRRLISNDVIFTGFAEILGNELKENVIKSVDEEITSFRDDAENQSLNTLKSHLKGHVNQTTKKIVVNAPLLLEIVIEENTKEVRKKIETVVAHYSNGGLDIKIPKIDIKNIRIANINLDNVIQEISKEIDVQSTNWTKWILTGVGAVFGLIGASVGYLLGKIFGGEKLSEEDKIKRAMDKKLDSDERLMVYESVKEKWEEIKSNIVQSIDHVIGKNKEFKRSINRETKKLLENYVKALKDARILID